MVDRPARNNHVDSKAEVEENPYFDKNKGENNKDHIDTQLSRERNENEQDTQTRSNIHMSDHTSDGKGEETVEGNQTQSSFDPKDEGGDNEGIEDTGAREFTQREQEPADQENADGVQEEQQAADTNAPSVASSGRATGEIQFAKPADVIENEQNNTEAVSPVQETRLEPSFEEQQTQDVAAGRAETEEQANNEEILPIEEVIEEVSEAPQEVAAPNNAPVISGVELEEFSSSLSLNEDGGTGDYAALASLDDFPTEALTIQINFTSDQPPVSSETNGISLASYAVSGSQNEFLLFAEPSGTLSAYINGQRTPLDVGDNDLFDGESHDLAVSWDSETGEVAIYVDGSLTDTATASTGQPLTAGGTMMLGQEQDSVGGSFDSRQEFSGEFHSIEVFSEVRTPEEIAADAGVSPEGGEGSLMLSFDFASDEPLNNIAGDEEFVLDGGAVITNLVDGVIEEDSSGINGQVLASDVDGNDLSFAISGAPAEGSVTVEADGSFHFNPGNDFQDLGVDESREVSFEIEVTDGQGGVDTQTVSVTVTGQNDGPIAEALVVETAEDNSIDGQLTAADIDGDNLSFSVHEQPTDGSVTINADGSFSFSPDNDFQDLAEGESRETSFSYEVNDGHGGTAIETVTVTVTGSNDAPVIGHMTNVVGSLDEVETITGTAMSLNEDGRSGDVAMVENMDDFPTEALTVEMRFSSTDAPDASETNGTSLFSYNASGAENEFLLFTEPSGSLGVYINGQRTGMDVDMNSLFDGEYHHLAVSWDSDSGEISVYIDGNLEDTATAQAGNPLKSGGTMTLGQEQDSLGGGFANNQEFSGKIADVQIFDEVRDADLIETDAATGGTMTDDSLVHAYDFGHSDSGAVTDQMVANDMSYDGAVMVEDAGLPAQTSIVELVVEEDGGAVTGTLTAKDVEGDDTTFSLVEGPAEGTVSIDADGNFEFDPGADFQDLSAGETREVSFSYQVDDGNGGVASATATVTVNGADEGQVIAGTVGAEDIQGGSGNDTLVFNADSTWSGYSAHNVETGENVGISGSNRSSDVFKGGDGHDTIEGTSGDDTLFIDDSFSDFASEKQARIQDVEEINMGDGNDIVDMTSSTHTYDQGIKVDGGDGNDTIWTSTGDDQINGGAGNDSMFGGDGDDTLTFLAHQGNDIVDGGEGGSWTDTLELGGFEDQGSEQGWTLSLNDGSSIVSTDELNSEIVFSGDAGGTLTFDDGGSVDFENIEKIVW